MDLPVSRPTDRPPAADLTRLSEGLQRRIHQPGARCAHPLPDVAAGWHRAGPARTAGQNFRRGLVQYKAGSWKGGIDGLEATAHRRLLDLDIANMPLAQIGPEAVRAALRPWDGTATARKVRTKIASVIDFAKGFKWFVGDNPAAAKTMGKIIPDAPRAKPQPAMPWADLPAFMAELAAFDTPASRALRLTILTASRAGETRYATWSEIAGDVWSRPAEHMKEGIAHSVPLTPQALALLGPRGKPGELIFSRPSGDALPERAMWNFIEARGYSVHGFRSTFTDWAAENGYPFELGELAIAHVVGNNSARAYRRTDMLDQRRPMMAAYAAFATSA